MTIEVLQNKEIFGAGKDGERKRVGFAIRPRRTNKGA